MHVLGAGLQTACDARAAPATCAEGDAFLHNDPYSATPTPPTTRILVPVFCDGEHLFTTSAKAHQADIGNAEPTTYMAVRAATSTRRAALNFPCVRIQRGYERRRRHHPDVPAPDPRAGAVVRRLPGDARRGPDRRAPAARAGRRATGSRRSAAVRRRVARLLRAAHGRRRSRKLPGGPAASRERARPDARARRRASRCRSRSTIDPERGPDRGRPAGQHRLRARRDQPVRGVARPTAPSSAIFNVLPERRAAQRGHASAASRCCCARAASSASRGFPALRLAGDHEHRSTGSSTPIQAAFAQLGDGARAGRGRRRVGAGYAVICGHRPASGGAVHQPADHRQQRRARARRAATAGSPTRCRTAAGRLQRQRRGRRAEVPDPASARVRLLPDSGGPGDVPRRARDRGGLRAPRARCRPCTSSPTSPPTRPRGCSAAAAGQRGRVTRIAADGTEQPLPAIGDIELEPGEWVRGCETGGGGYGDPLARDPGRVLADVHRGVGHPGSRDRGLRRDADPVADRMATN